MSAEGRGDVCTGKALEKRFLSQPKPNLAATRATSNPRDGDVTTFNDERSGSIIDVNCTVE